MMSSIAAMMQPALGGSGMMGSGMGGNMMASDCPCMQMRQMMMGSPMGWLAGIVMTCLALAALVTLIALSVFLIRRSRPAGPR